MFSHLIELDDVASMTLFEEVMKLISPPWETKCFEDLEHISVDCPQVLALQDRSQDALLAFVEGFKLATIFFFTKGNTQQRIGDVKGTVRINEMQRFDQRWDRKFDDLWIEIAQKEARVTDDIAIGPRKAQVGV